MGELVWVGGWVGGWVTYLGGGKDTNGGGEFTASGLDERVGGWVGGRVGGGASRGGWVGGWGTWVGESPHMEAMISLHPADISWWARRERACHACLGREVGGWVGGWVNELFSYTWEGRGGRGGSNELLWVGSGWVGGWVGGWMEWWARRERACHACLGGWVGGWLIDREVEEEQAVRMS